MGLFDNPNPFHRTVLHDRDLFSGERHQESLRKIKRVLKRTANSNQSRSFIISGDRGVGKSSLLNILSSESEDYNSISINIVLTDQIASNSWEFFYLLFKQTIVSIENKIDNEDFILWNNEILNTNSGDNTRYLKFINSYYAKKDIQNTILHSTEIIEGFNYIIESLRDKEAQKMLKLTFCIDEAQKIYDKKDIIEIIREIVEKEIGVSLILAGEEPKMNDELEKVFGSKARGFEIEKLIYFRELTDMKRFFTTSLKKIGWSEKDIERRGIHKYEKTLFKIGNLTNGKPDFIVDIASRMYEQGCEIGKMKLSERILDNITEQIEKSTNIEKINIGGKDIEKSFDASRANYILTLERNKRQWVKILISTQLAAPPLIIYNLFKIHFPKDELMTYEEFLNLFKELENKNIFASLYEKSEESTSKLGYKQNKEDEQNINNYFERYPFVYCGNFDELKWLSIKSQTIHSERFNFEIGDHVFSILLDSIIKEKCKLNAKNFLVRWSEKGYKGYNNNGITNTNIIEESEFSTFLDSISSKTIDTNSLKDIDNKPLLDYAYKVLDLASSEKKDIEMLTIYISVKGLNVSIQKSINQLYTDSPSYKIKKTILDHLKEGCKRFNDIDLDFKIEHLKIENFPNMSNINEIILTNDISLESKNQAIRSIINDIRKKFENKKLNFNQEKKNIDLLIKRSNNASKSNLYNEYNNLAYILLSKNKINLAEKLLRELYLDYSIGKILKEDLAAVPFIIYNDAIINYTKKEYQLSKQKFQEAIDFIENNDQTVDAGYLFVLKPNQKIENVEKGEDSNSIDFIEFCKNNIDFIDSI